MTEHVRNWLPITIVEHDGLRAITTTVLDAWSRAWFPDAGFGLASLTAKTGEAPSCDEDAAWRAGESGIALSCSRRAMARLLDLALDIRVGDVSPSEPERAVLAAFEGKLLDDLRHRLESALGVDRGAGERGAVTQSPFAGAGGAVLGICDAHGGALLTVAIPFEVALRVCRPAPQRSRRPGPRFEKLVEALGSTTVTLEAFLGSVDIALAELRTIARGDVLVLDTALSQPAQLTLANSDTPVASAKLVDIEGRMALVAVS